MLGDTSIPLAQRIAWVWEQVAKVHPEFKREYFQGLDDDPHMIYTIVADNGGLRFSGFPGAQVMDIGANRGVFTALCALNGAKVVAYEPNSFAYAKLLETIFRIKIQDKVVAKNCAVWTYTGLVPFIGSQPAIFANPAECSWDSFNGSLALIEHKDVAPKVPCISLADAIGEQEWNCVKIDIEGAEFELLIDASDATLQHIRYLTVELHHGWADGQIYGTFISRLSRIFELTGLPNGPGGRFTSIYATRKPE